MPQKRTAENNNEISKSIIAHRILLPNEKSRVEDLERVLESIVNIKAMNPKGANVRNQNHLDEKQLEMRIKLRRKLEKKRSKKK